MFTTRIMQAVTLLAVASATAEPRTGDNLGVALLDNSGRVIVSDEVAAALPQDVAIVDHEGRPVPIVTTSCFPSGVRGFLHKALRSKQFAGNVSGAAVGGTVLLVGLCILHPGFLAGKAVITLVPFNKHAIYASLDRALIAGIATQQYVRRQWARDQMVLDGQEYPSNLLTLGDEQRLRGEDQLGDAQAPSAEDAAWAQTSMGRADATCRSGLASLLAKCPCACGIPYMLGRPDAARMQAGAQNASDCWAWTKKKANQRADRRREQQDALRSLRDQFREQDNSYENNLHGRTD